MKRCTVKRTLPESESQVLGLLVKAQCRTRFSQRVTLGRLYTVSRSDTQFSALLLVDKGELQRLLAILARKQLVVEQRSGVFRQSCYTHRLVCHDRSRRSISIQEGAIFTALLAHGPMGPSRLFEQVTPVCSFNSMVELRDVLNRMVQCCRSPLIALVPFEAGHVEPRYTHIFDPGLCQSG